MKSKAPPKIRLSLDLSRDTNELLTSLAEASDYSKSDVVRRSIAIFSKLLEAERQGQTVAVVDDKNRVVTKLLTVL